MKRIVLFLVTNLAVVLLLSVVLFILGAFFGISSFDAQGNLNLIGLFIVSMVIGMGGSFISLMMSKWSAKMMTGAKVIESPRTPDEIWLVETVQRQARQANIGMPEVAIYDASEMNAFATGMSKNKALVAVSRGLLDSMTKDEVEAVLGHEISHVANGDMVTLALVQGVVNTFVIFLSRIIGYFVDKVVFKNEEGPGIGYFITSIVAQIILGILASSIVMWFSRYREFRADAGSAQLVSADKMIAALRRLQRGQEAQLPEQLAAFGISSSEQRSFIAKVFSSHPPLEERIEALQKG